MNQTNIDYLYQAIVPAADRATSASRGGNDAPGFDDHLNLASASAFEAASPPRRSNSDTGSSTTDDRPASPREESSPNAASDTPCDSASTCQDGTSGTTSSSADAGQSSEEAGESEQPLDRADDDRDTKKTDDDGIAAATIALSTVGTNPAVKAAAETHQAEHVAAGQAEGEDAAVETDRPKHTRGTSSNESASQADANAHEANAKLAVAAETETATSDSTDEANGSAHSTDETPENAASSKEARHGADADPAQATTASHEATQEPKQEHDRYEITTEPAAVVKEAAEPAVADAKASANTKAATPARADASTDDDSRRDGKKSARANTRGEAPAPANVSATTAIANGVTPHIADAADDVDKTKDASDPATKPVSAKHEIAVGPLGRALRATADIARGSRSTGAHEGPQVDPARFVGRVAKAFQTANERGGTLQLRLSPPELGSLKIQLTVKDGVMSAALEADNSNARRLLLDHLPALRDRLAEQNIRVERFDVDVRQENGGGQANPRGSNHNPHQQNADQSDARRAAGAAQRANEVALPEVPAVAPRISSTGINLVV